MLAEAVLRVMRPLVRVMLRYGMPYKAFVELVKAAYVEIAEQEFTIAGRKQTDSRIAVITGLTRKEVKRTAGREVPDDYPNPELYNRAARVISGWTHDADFVDQSGEPLELLMDSDNGVSFTKLVRRHSGDAPPRAVLDELERVGAVKRAENSTLVLVSRAYIPQAEDTDKVAFLGAAVGQLIRTIDRNFWGAPEDAALQRIVSNDKISSEKVPEFRALSKQEGQQLLENLDRWLTNNETKSNYLDPGDMHRVGMGLYYFEDD